MFTRKGKQEAKQQPNQEMLSKNEMQQLKAAFSDISFSPKQAAYESDDPWNQTQQVYRESPLIMAYRRIKQTFYDLNSRSFDMFSYFSTRLGIGKQIELRPELQRICLVVNSLEILTVGMALFLPRKFVYKILFTLFFLTVSNQFLQKFMLNYFIEQFALHNNKMEPIEQQARNLIEYKYRISKLAQEKAPQETDTEIKKLLEQVDRKNIEYLKFKKVQMLL